MASRRDCKWRDSHVNIDNPINETINRTDCIRSQTLDFDMMEHASLLVQISKICWPLQQEQYRGSFSHGVLPPDARRRSLSLLKKKMK